ncbi:MAG: glycerol-3-phosphate acyltransferase [Actinomycetota bacterium]
MALLGLGVGYLLGSLPSTWLLGRWRGVDLRRSGTGNVGSANLAHSSGVGIAVVGFFFDAAKGVAAAFLGGIWGDAGRVLAGLGVVAGHGWPPWLRFAGGRSQTVALSAGAVIAPWGTLAILPILGVGFFSRRLALSWPVAVVVWPVVSGLADGAAAAVYAAGAAMLTLVLRLIGSRQMPRQAFRRAWRSRLLYDREE